ncbi:MAG: glutathione S-transferase family protein [Gammaproteobacteria bacterium]
MSTDSTLILYGVPFSQPVRAVMWLLVMKRVPFRLQLINPGSSGPSGSRHPDFLARNPAGTIPVLEDPASGFVLGEAHAIMCYLCNRYGWTDLYPDGAEARGRVDAYLHYHHRNVRPASLALVAPRIRKDLTFNEAVRADAEASFTAALTALERGWLKNEPFIAGASLTLADLAAYAEIGQTRACFTNTYDFSGLPNVQGWIERMVAVDGHDLVHVALRELGDISQEPPSMERIKQANRTALHTLNAAIEEFTGAL